MDALTIALVVTVVGMGLVFAGILLLWALIWLLMRLTAEADDSASREAQTVDAPALTATSNHSEDERKRRAAAAVAVAVAVAISQKKVQQEAFVVAPPSQESAWQTVMRINQRTRRGSR